MNELQEQTILRSLDYDGKYEEMKRGLGEMAAGR